MKTPVTDMFGIEFPILAFSHCRDVVAAVSRAGGLGVLGAVGHSDEALEVDLNWIEDEVGDRPYGIDLIVPARYAGDGEGGLKMVDIVAMIPDPTTPTSRKRVPVPSASRRRALTCLGRSVKDAVDQRIDQSLPGGLDDVLRHPDGGPGPLTVGGVDKHPGHGGRALAGL